MAETSDSAAGNDPLTSSVDQDVAQGSIDSFWFQEFPSTSFWNQDEASTSEWGDSGNGLEFAFGSSVKGAGVSSLDYEWGHVLENSSKKKRKKKKTDVSSSIALNSASDLSEALSQISKDLSLSSSSSSGEIDGDRENEEADLLKSHGENLQAELGQKMDTSTIPAFIHCLLECNGVDMLSSDSDGYEDEIQATSVFGASESKDSCQKPEIGMEFSSEEEAYKFYEGYANKIGFKTRKGKVQRLANGPIKKRFFFCSKQGFRSKKQADKITKYKRKETRTGCDAKIQLTVENRKWVVSQFNQEHNHDLENQRHITRSCPKTSEARLILTENNAEMAKDAGTPKSTELCNMVCSTCVHDKTRDSKHAEEVQNLLNYLRHLQVEDLSLFYAVQLDSNNRLKNLFWRDGRSMVDYDYFGDVLILDTTFRMDKYDMICAPFWGLNHHRQYVMFGCAFLLDESKESFVWLLETFMEAMGRKQPKTIVTDENQVMIDAVKVVLLDAEHQLGAWFIRRNALKHVFAFYSQPAFESIFNACISDCQTEEEFESKWDFLLKKFNLRENAWLNNLYLSRERWANVFHKETFSAGIKWCEDIINVFQNSTSDTMNLSMFVHQYLKVVETQRLEELYEDLRCGETTKVLISGSAMEKQAANIYTRKIFSIFQGELVKTLSVAIEEIVSDGTNATFKLTEEGQKESIVEFSCLDSNLACSCKKYESEGILCVHAFKVLNARNIFHIPARYILKRWTICAKDSVAEDEHGQKLADQKQQPMIFLLKKTLDVIYKTSAFEDCQKIAMHYLDKASKRVEAVLRTKTTDHLKSRKGDESPESESQGWNPYKVQKLNPASSANKAIEQSAKATMRKARVSVRTRSEAPMISDGCRWRKYGEKMAKGNRCPRAYYRCNMAEVGCRARKRVQRCTEDKTILITTYEGNHNHPLPPAAMTMASTTTAAATMLLSGSMSSADGMMNPNLLARAILPGCSSSMATISASAPFPTVTLDLTNNTNPLQFQRPPSQFQVPFPGQPQNFALVTTPQLPQGFGQALYNQSQFSGLTDTLSAATAAITSDPNFTAALAAAISSIIGGANFNTTTTINNNNNNYNNATNTSNRN